MNNPLAEIASQNNPGDHQHSTDPKKQGSRKDNLRLVTPHRLYAFAYSHYYKAEFDGQQVRLYFSDDVITLSGAGLEPLYHAIVGRKAEDIAQIDPDHAEELGLETYVSEIVITPRGE